MKNGTLMLAMNGRECTSLNHKEVIKEVQSGGKNCVIRCQMNPTDEPNESPDAAESKPGIFEVSYSH